MSSNYKDGLPTKDEQTSLTHQCNLYSKEKERNNKLEEKSFIDEVKLPEIQVACKGSNQPEDIEPVKSASIQQERQEVLSNPVNSLPDEKEQKVIPEIVVSNLGLNAGWSAGTDKEVERNEKLEEKSFFDEVELPEVRVARKESNQPEDTEPEKSASHQPERQDVLSDPVNGSSR